MQTHSMQIQQYYLPFHPFLSSLPVTCLFMQMFWECLAHPATGVPDACSHNWNGKHHQVKHLKNALLPY
jgi:hypothetical protein